MGRRTFAWAGMLWLSGMGAALAQDVLPAAALRAVAAPPAIMLEAGRQGPIPLETRSRYWIDHSSRSTIDEVEAAGDALPWVLRESGQQYKIDGKALWLQFDTVARSHDRWYVELASSGVDRAQLFYRDDAGKWAVQEAGDSKAVSQWPLPGRVPTFELAQATGKPVRYWLRIEHARVNFAAPIALYNQGALLAAREFEQFLLGAYFGLAALVALVAAGNAVGYRDRSFGAYAIYVVALSAGQVAYLGVGAQHVWDNWLKWNELASFILPGVSTAIALWFVKVVTEPARFSRALDLAVWSLIAALLSAVALDTFLASRTTFALVMALTALGLVMVVALIAMVWTRGEDPHIRLIALGFVPVLVMAIFPVARGLNLIPNSALTRYGLPIGAALEMPILFYALSLRGARRRESQVRAAALAHSDALTGLAHSRLLVQRLETALARARNQKHACALLAAKLSNHEHIAAEFGREISERALVVAASVLRHACTDIDLAARIGERDFALLLEGPTTTEHAIMRAQQVIAKGLQQAEALPPTVTLRFQIAVAMLPDQDLDATGSVKWVLEAANAIRPDARRAIRPLNF